jgi:hypothetical protein
VIEIYPSPLPGEPIERHAHDGTFGEWIRANAPGYAPGPAQPILVEQDGREIPPEEWDDLRGDVAVRVKAQGGIGGFLSDVVGGLFGWLVQTPKIRTPKPGEAIKMADARANTARLGQTIPEIAGRFRRYPDYLVPPHRYFQNAREQLVDLFLCIGKGTYEIAASAIRVGDTPLISLGDDASFKIFQPGQPVGGDDRAAWWHSAPEVGGSGLGKAGLELKTTYEVDPISTASAYQFDGLDVIIPTGAGAFPDGWAAGMIARIELFRTYDVEDGGSGPDVISGALDELDLFVGMLIEIAGDNAGTYVVGTYDPGDSVTPPSMTLEYPDSAGSPVTGLLTGARRMAIGFDGLRYRFTAAGTDAHSVERLTDEGDADTWAGWDFIETSDATITLDPGDTEADWCGPFAACPPGEVTATLELDFVLPEGLTNVSDQGKVRDHSVDVEIQWREIDEAGAWSSEIITYEEATLDQLGFTERLEIGGTYRPEVRCRVIRQSDSSKIRDTVQWFGLRALLDAPDSYAGVTTLAVRIRGGDRLAAQAENLISVECTRELPVLEGTAFTEASEATRSIASWVRYVARSIGYTDDQLDMDELVRLDAIWRERGDVYDWVQDESTVRDVINQAFRAGFAELTVDAGRIRPVRDEPRDTFEHLYTPQNMTAELVREFEAIRPDDPDGVDVEYMDSTTWTRSVVECRLDGDAGIKADKLTVDGVTDRTRAWRMGMRARRAARYRRWQYGFATELDALNSRYLSYCALADDVPGYGKSSVLIAASGDSGGMFLTVSEPMDWTAGDNVVAVRMPDGSVLGPFVATEGPAENVIYAVDMGGVPAITAAHESPHVLFGSTARWTFPALVTEISPSGFESVGVTAINYDARVYADDDNSPD